MKLKLTGKKTALLRILLDEGVPPQFGDDSSKTRRTTAVKITVKKGKDSVGTVEGVAFCHPNDEFDSFLGRRTAMRKAFDKATKKLLSKKDRRAIAEKVVAEVF
jgi:hypothetical protein